MLLLIDNYDSFTYNLYQLIGQLTDQPIRVVKNDDLTVAQVRALHPAGIVLSPGPGRPEDAGITEAVVAELAGEQPIFGVCLGHQAICHVYGGNIVAAPVLMHGKTSPIQQTQANVLLANCPDRFTVARYHSLVAADPVGQNLTITATTADDEIMAVADDAHQVYGVQFHPESIMTDPAAGRQIIENFLALTAAKVG
ncbi:anthranilate synthase component II [Loigolactobacillus bifermentans]|uniref:Anthranilate synthase component II n=1 Tax=Loigolactobacillus bifermentans DSM 20003 TaxID=1423726 RepID=A0A0R1GS92_9LACO|nr:aminodeoxychorismate/anthranilate synthase component II [Loigolactobacillus bifermentans]KRK34673.1 anthranilate synthase component II [Loigolactobacillus bifermentans DSM 20003]QGG61061.1 aminodeoxychorismate/anthranilate synthase component II [Loigolactobacillus bifermentans]